MAGLISIVILFLSLAGLAVILLRKMPVLVKLPERDFAFGNSLAKGIKSGMKKIPVIKDFSYELYLQKALSRVRILTLKTESKTGSWLERLRQKNFKKNHTNNDGYWDTLKKAKDDK
ncbi:MAG: hypothetical protein UV65_C0027G0011 [Parcubacteria group bacterium GW2011_GWF2_43_11]|nr:MAG: hypothetical protein UV65_C0027G0011 [Parcubacteria group bacterium GW2011_GWF2_43_11]